MDEITTSAARLTFADDVLYAADADGNVYGIDPATGGDDSSLGRTVHQSLTVVDGAGYFGGTDGRLFSVSPGRPGPSGGGPCSCSSSRSVPWVSSTAGSMSHRTRATAIREESCTPSTARLASWSGASVRRRAGSIGPPSVADGIAYPATEGRRPVCARCAHRGATVARRRPDVVRGARDRRRYPLPRQPRRVPDRVRSSGRPAALGGPGRGRQRHAPGHLGWPGLPR